MKWFWMPASFAVLSVAGFLAAAPTTAQDGDRSSYKPQPSRAVGVATVTGSLNGPIVASPSNNPFSGDAPAGPFSGAAVWDEFVPGYATTGSRFFEDSRSINEFDQKAVDLSREYLRESQVERRSEMETEIRSLLAKALEEQLTQRKQELDRLKAELEQMTAKLQQRTDLSDEIVDKRFRDLTRQPDPLRWETGNPPTFMKSSGRRLPAMRPRVSSISSEKLLRGLRRSRPTDSKPTDSSDESAPDGFEWKEIPVLDDDGSPAVRRVLVPLEKRTRPNIGSTAR